METYPWKKQIQEAVAAAGYNCSHTRKLLLHLQRYLETPRVTHTGDAASATDVTTFAAAEKSLGDASGKLRSAATTMEAVELLVLRCSGDNPAAPLSSINSLLLPNDNGLALLLWHALCNLERARQSADEAFGAMERCRGHLGAATLLLGHPDVPGVDDCIGAERDAAVIALKDAHNLVEGIKERVGDASNALQAMASMNAPPGSHPQNV